MSANGVVERSPAALKIRAGVYEAAWIRRKYSCGHWGPWRFNLSIGGEITRRYWRSKLCPECLAAHLASHSIVCCRCGRTMIPGDLVVPYSPSYAGFAPDRTTLAKLHGETVSIGCFRYTCGDLGFPEARWTGERLVPHEPKMKVYGSK